MDARTEKALRESIVKWEKNAKADDPRKNVYGAEGCPLCGLFNIAKAIGKTCVGCPVHAKTGKTHCRGTPYANAYTASYSGPSVFRAAAQLEVDFLKSLLPQEPV